MEIIGVCLTLFGLSVAIITIQNNIKKSREDQNIVELRLYERAILAVIANEGDIAVAPTPTKPQITRGTENGFKRGPKLSQKPFRALNASYNKHSDRFDQEVEKNTP
jgi:hypothetical protein